MDVQSFNNEFGLAQLQFSKIFTGIKLSRKYKNKPIYVPCVFGQRSRILKNLENPSTDAVSPLPVIVITRTGFSRDPSRVANLHLDKQLSPYKGKYDPNAMTPQPINITYSVAAITKYPNDMDEILSNFLVFFNQDIYVKTSHPKLPDEFQKSQVVWDGSVTEEWPDQLDSTVADIQVCTTTFTYKTYLYGGTEIVDLKPNAIEGIGIGFYKETDFEPVDFNSVSAFGPQGETDLQAVLDALSSYVTGANTLPAPVPYPRGRGIVFYAVPSLYRTCSQYIDELYNSQILEPEYDAIPGKFSFKHKTDEKYLTDGKKESSEDPLSSYVL